MRPRGAGLCGSGGPLARVALPSMVEVVQRGEEDGDAVATRDGKDGEEE